MKKNSKEFIENRDLFIQELKALISKCGMDTFTETPDFILADYLWRQIEMIENLNDQKNWWSGKKIQHTEPANVGNTIRE